MNPWISVKECRPPENEEVETKIDDQRGIRNVTTLKLHNNLWWFPDMSMYIYYCPTHWRKLTSAAPKEPGTS